MSVESVATEQAGVGALPFHAATRTWLDEAFRSPTTIQQMAWPTLAAGDNALLLAPTGSGKTLAAFLAAIDRLMFAEPAEQPAAGVQVLYISPLKALGVDVDRNLRAPLAGIRTIAEREQFVYREPRVAVRSGDTSPAERREIARRPPEILITTPESLYLMLTSKSASVLEQVQTVIVDEIHAVAATKRGAHLFLTLERLERLRSDDARPLQRIGLSATQRPLETIARLLGGGVATSDPEETPRPRPVEILNASQPKRLDLSVEVPVEDMTDLAGSIELESGPTSVAGPPAATIWSAIHPRLVELIRAHRSTMIFVNSRRLAERLAAAINEAAEEELAQAHHGSLARSQRIEIEDRLKRGQLPAIVATSSLELGIDMGAVDQVIQIEAPPTIASGLQRIGRAGHHVDAVSRGVMIPKFRGDLVAASAAAEQMLKAQVESTRYPKNPLDVLAQQLVAMTALESVHVDQLYATVRCAAPFHDLPRSLFDGVLDLLSGRYPSDEFAELRPRVTWDRITGQVSTRKGSQRIAVLNAGTIPDRGLYGVYLAEGDGGGRRVGELDEEMVFETQVGDVFLLGASSWRVLEITRDRVLVAPAPGEPGKMPFWRGDGPGRPLDFGLAIGAMTRRLAAQSDEEALQTLRQQHCLDPKAAKNLVEYLREQSDATGELPTDRSIVVESFLDEIGDWRVVILSPFGRQVHAPWAIAAAARLREAVDMEIDFTWTDDGMAFRLLASDNPPDLSLLLPDPQDVEDQVVQQLGGTSLFAARFRENAARALLLPRQQPQRRTPLWLQRRRSADLLAVASRYERFPILLETYRECLRDVFDVPGLKRVLSDISRQQIRVHQVDTPSASPFASSLMFNYTANFLYEGDAPLAERRAHALALDHSQLRELLGAADLRELLDAEAIDQIVLELQRLDPPRVHNADALHDLLLNLGDLSSEEIRDRTLPEAVAGGQIHQWIEQLTSTRRIIEIRVAGTARFAAAEDASRLRDGLGVVLPPGLPEAFLESGPDPLVELTSRYARTHGPFIASDVADRLGVSRSSVELALEKLVRQDRVVAGEFLPAGSGREWCDAQVLRRIKRRSLARLRKQIEPAPPEAFARLLPAWQGVDRPRRGMDALLDILEQLEGTPLAASALDRDILPARLADYHASDLDELFAAGEVVWRGIESVGAGDGRIAVYLTDHFAQLAPPPATVEDELPCQIRDLLAERGALFFDEIVRSLGGFPNDLVDALWQLVWAGLVTNDALTALRSRGGRTISPRRHNGRRRAFRSRRKTRQPGAEGRWSLLQYDSDDVTPTTRQTALVEQLLDRYGIVTRAAIDREQIAGGFAAIYPVLRAMEEAGRVRRGYFVEGMGGAQFALPGADDALRRQSDEEPPVVLSAVDPANAYGAMLRWPASASSSHQPKRIAGARVVLDGGQLIGYLTASRRHVSTFPVEDSALALRQLTRLAETLARLGDEESLQLIDRIDGATPGESPLASLLIEKGFVATHSGYQYRPRRDI